jgi:hypothetical protein
VHEAVNPIFVARVYISILREMEQQQQRPKLRDEQQLAEMEALLAAGELLVEDKLRLQLEIKKKVGDPELGSSGFLDV